MVILFFFTIFVFYTSENNIRNKNQNRNNINIDLKNKTSKLETLNNDTKDVIEFNSTFSDNIKNDKSRSFWNLFKIK